MKKKNHNLCKYTSIPTLRYIFQYSFSSSISVMAEVEEHPLFDPKVKVQEKPRPEPKRHDDVQASSSSSNVLDDDDSGGGAFALFDAMEAEAKSAPSPTSTKKKSMYNGPELNFECYPYL